MSPADQQFSLTDRDYARIFTPYLANGINTLRVMSALPEHIALREHIDRGEVLDPRLILARMIDSPAQS